MKLKIQHSIKGILLLSPCEGHSHSACWVFEEDIPIKDRFNRLPVTFDSKKKAEKYIKWLIEISSLEKRDIKILEDRTN